MSTEQKPVGANHWMVSDAGQQQGPYMLDQLKQMIRDGRLSPAALVWAPGMAEWKAWNQVPELGGTEPATPRPAPQFTSKGPSPSSLSSPSSPSGGGTLIEYLNFRKMITPVIIQIIFWLGIAAVAVGSLGTLISAVATGYWLAMILGFFVSLLVFALGAVTVRVYCELVVVVFRILETLTDIRANLEKK